MANQSEAREFVISRVFDVPRDLLYRIFTEPQHMKQWWGPKGFTVVKLDIDLRPGGIQLYGMKAPDGSMMWGKFVYREIKPPERLVFINSFSDENAGTTRHPMAPTWPLQTLSTFTFEEAGPGKTRLTIHWLPYEASDEEIDTFNAGHASMTGGWTGTLNKLTEYLKTQRNR